MTEMPALLDLASAAARHAAARQAVVARNVANADTPGYRAMTLPAFSPDGADGLAMRRTHPAHLGGGASEVRARPLAAAPDPNGNTVTLEDQVLRGVNAQRAHGRAVTVYSAALGLIRAGLGRG